MCGRAEAEACSGAGTLHSTPSGHISRLGNGGCGGRGIEIINLFRTGSVRRADEENGTRRENKKRKINCIYSIAFY